MKVFLALIAMAAASYVYPANADDFQYGKPLVADQIFARCPIEHGDLATGICLGHQINQLQLLLKVRLEKDMAEIDQSAARSVRSAIFGGLNAADWKRDFIAAQEAWKQYDTRECGNVSAYDHAGGSAAGLYQQACQIRHLVLRINELASP